MSDTTFGFSKTIAGFDDLPNWGPSSQLILPGRFEKVAQETFTPDSLLEVIAKLQPDSRGVYALINALGAYEYWGVNRNGDAFPSWSLIGAPPPAVVIDNIVQKAKERKIDWKTPERYGHETFVTDAKAYPNHANKDPEKKIGDVIASAYNPRMHRAELVVFILRDKAPEVVRNLENDVPVPWSMGSRLPADHCSLCANLARNRAEYCSHLRTAMGHTLPDGRKVFAFNFFPKFFDISAVNRPADNSAWTLRKVASLSRSRPVPPEKKYNQELPNTVNTVDARLLSKVAADRRAVAPLSARSMAALTKLGFLSAVQHCAAVGILLTNKEAVALGASDELIKSATLSFDKLDRHILDILSDDVKNRSMFEPYFSARVTKLASTDKTIQSCKFAKLFDLNTMNLLTSFVESSGAVAFALEKEAAFSRLVTPKPQQMWLPFVVATLS